ncbi:MAG: hypothetical protein DRR08_26580 [Candidatus Parabeggiatoa sp. nov. 2]|nr:MAG: hypothetical protein B6247_25535 [Beggiatoa sp. 4572_84]RKZ54311.1 MAG: hypothetical protein DRR08_26580 [Gammaproteobacteria bacterium]
MALKKTALERYLGIFHRYFSSFRIPKLKLWAPAKLKFGRLPKLKLWTPAKAEALDSTFAIKR